MSEQAAPPAKVKRGRESAADMVRSLGLVLIIVLLAFFLAQPPDSDEAAIRVIDPSGDVRSFAQTHPGVPVPTRTPPGWRATVADSDRDLLRVGWVTSNDTYVEYAASSGSAVPFLEELTDSAPRTGEVDIAGTTWATYVKGESTSLVQSVAGSTVIVGTLRGDASAEDLRLLAGLLTR